MRCDPHAHSAVPMQADAPCGECRAADGAPAVRQAPECPGPPPRGRRGSTSDRGGGEASRLGGELGPHWHRDLRAPRAPPLSARVGACRRARDRRAWYSVGSARMWAGLVQRRQRSQVVQGTRRLFCTAPRCTTRPRRSPALSPAVSKAPGQATLSAASAYRVARSSAARTRGLQQVQWWSSIPGRNQVLQPQRGAR